MINKISINSIKPTIDTKGKAALQNFKGGEQKKKQSFVDLLLTTGTTGFGALGGFAYNKIKEPNLLKDAKNNFDSFTKTLNNSFEEQELVSVLKNLIGELEKNLENNLTSQKEAKELIEKLESPIEKDAVGKSLLKLEFDYKQIAENLQNKRAYFEDLKKRTVIEPAEDMYKKALEQIGKTKKINILIGGAIGLSAGLAIIIGKILNNKRTKE